MLVGIQDRMLIAYDQTVNRAFDLEFFALPMYIEGSAVVLCLRSLAFSPSNAEATFVHGTRTQRFSKNNLNPAMLVFIGKLSLGTL